MDIFRDIIKAIKGAGMDTVTVGAISKELKNEFLQHSKNEEIFNVDMEIEILEARKQWLQGSLSTEEVEVKQAAIDVRKKAGKDFFRKEYKILWDRLYQELKMNEDERSKHYTLDINTGTVTTQVEKEPTNETSIQ